MKPSPQPTAEHHGVAITESTCAGTSVRWLNVSLSLSICLAALGTSIANVGLPTLAQTFSASFQQVQWVVLAYLLAITSLVVSAGRLGDVLGRRRMLLFGIFLFTLASLLCSVAPTLWLLIAARAAQGMGAAIMMALTLTFVGAAVAKEKAGSAMGLLGTMSAIGTALGPSLGGALINGFGWRAIFFINLPLGALTYFLAYRFLPIDRGASAIVPARLDFVGTFLLALTLTAFALALTLERNNFGLLNVGLLLLSALGLGAFMRVEAQAEAPLIQMAMLQSPNLCAGFAMSILVTTVVMATLVVGPFYLSGALTLSASQIGMVMSCGPMVAALVGVPAGRLVDRLGAYRMIIVGLLAMALGTSLLSLLPTSLGVPGYIAPLIVITAGYALFQAANNTAVMTDIWPDQRGVISGMLNLSRNLGLITGASLMATIFALGSGTGAATISIINAQASAIAAGMRITFALAATLIIIALGVAVLSRTLSQRSMPESAQTKLS